MAAMRRIAIWAGALILGVAALAGFRYYDVARPWMQANLPAWIGGGTSADFIIVSGNIEAHESVVSFKTVQSRIVELPFDEGAQVKAGTVLARVDRSDYDQQVVIARANLNAQMKQLDVAEQNVEATRKTVVSDEADVALKQLEYDRAQTLLHERRGHGRRARRRTRPRSNNRERRWSATRRWKRPPTGASRSPSPISKARAPRSRWPRSPSAIRR